MYSFEASYDSRVLRSIKRARNRRGWILAVVYPIAALSGASAWGHQLGVIGPVYPIAEQDAVVLVRERLDAKARSGQLAALQRIATRRAITQLTTVTPVAGLSAVVTRTSRLIDPSVHYKEAVRTDNGRVVVPAGTSINPLDHMPFSRTLVFFDGRDRAQREGVLRMLQHPDASVVAQVRPILVAGAWLDLTRKWQTQVFVDQNAVLSGRFGVKAVPTVIRAQGRALLVEEIPPEDLR